MPTVSLYERGNQRLLRLATLIDKAVAGTTWRRLPGGQFTTSVWAQFYPSRWKTDGAGYSGRRKYARGATTELKRINSAIKEFELSFTAATSLFGDKGTAIRLTPASAKTLRDFVAQRRDPSYPGYVAPASRKG